MVQALIKKVQRLKLKMYKAFASGKTKKGYKLRQKVIAQIIKEKNNAKMD